MICQPKLRNSSHNYKYTKLTSTQIMLYIQETLLRGNYILWMYWKVAMEFCLWHTVYLRVTDYRGKKCWPGTWFRWSIFDWMLRCGRGLSRLIGKVLYRSSKKSMSFSPEGSILIFFNQNYKKKSRYINKSQYDGVTFNLMMTLRQRLTNVGLLRGLLAKPPP